MLCAKNCSVQVDKQAERDKWFKSNPPKYAVGDILEVSDCAVSSYAHKFFNVCNVYENNPQSPTPGWMYSGIIGSDGYSYEPHAYNDISEADVKLVTSKAEFESKCNELRCLFPYGSISEFSVSGGKDGEGIELVISFKDRVTPVEVLGITVNEEEEF